MPAQRYARMPAAQVLAFTATNFAQAVMLMMPMTVAVYLVRGFVAASSGAAAPGGSTQLDEALIGRLTGALAAVYSFSQFSTSYLWGVASNRWGRKCVMVAGSAASASTLVWFGLSASYGSAVAARAVAGLCNGIIVSWKCAIGESCQALEQGRVSARRCAGARACASPGGAASLPTRAVCCAAPRPCRITRQVLSLMSLAWGVGCVVGPTLGGITSTPCKHMLRARCVRLCVGRSGGAAAAASAGSASCAGCAGRALARPV
jgi:MFS family permease